MTPHSQEVVTVSYPSSSRADQCTERRCIHDKQQLSTTRVFTSSTTYNHPTVARFNETVEIHVTHSPHPSPPAETLWTECLHDPATRYTRISEAPLAFPPLGAFSTTLEPVPTVLSRRFARMGRKVVIKLDLRGAGAVSLGSARLTEWYQRFDNI